MLQEQLRNHQPLTITHPQMKRFFMIIREAVALVVQAAASGERGDILVLDMGAPVRILDLVQSLIRLSGKSESDVEIQFTGLRDGEKLEEELFYAHENVLPTACEKIKRTQGPVREWRELRRQLDELRASMSVDGAAPVRAKIKEIVSEDRLPEPVALEREPSAFAAAAGGFGWPEVLARIPQPDALRAVASGTTRTPDFLGNPLRTSNP